MGGIILLAFFLGIPALVMVITLTVQRSRHLSKPWETIAIGEHDHTEYGYEVVSERSGTMVHTSGHRRMDLTVVYLTDRRSFVLKGRHSMPFAQGHRVKIMEHPWHGRKVVDADETV